MRVFQQNQVSGRGSCHDLQTALKFDPPGPAALWPASPSPVSTAHPCGQACSPDPHWSSSPPPRGRAPSAPAGLVAPHCASTLGSAVQRRLAGRRASARVRPQASFPDLARASGEVGRGGCGQEPALTLWPAALANTRKSEGPYGGWGPALRGPGGRVMVEVASAEECVGDRCVQGGSQTSPQPSPLPTKPRAREQLRPSKRGTRLPLPSNPSSLPPPPGFPGATLPSADASKHGGSR